MVFTAVAPCSARRARRAELQAAAEVLRRRPKPRLRSISRATGSPSSRKTGAGAWSLPSKATSPAFPSTPKDASSATRGIPPRTKPPGSSARPMALRRSCACPGACTSPGPTTIRCASTPTPERKPACSTSTGNASGNPAASRAGKATPSPIGNGLCAGRARRKPDWEPLVRARKAGRLKPSPRYCVPDICVRTARPTAPTRLLKEYFDLSKERNGDTWFVVTTVVEDPQYLSEPFVTSTNWKKEADGSKWSSDRLLGAVTGIAPFGRGSASHGILVVPKWQVGDRPPPPSMISALPLLLVGMAPPEAPGEPRPEGAPARFAP